MKKSKFLVLALAVAVMLMGAGYAYWTQELTIENNISTGNLDVVFANPDWDVDDYMDVDDNDKSDVSVSEDGYGLTVDLKDAYPGADIMISFNLDNEGTLGAHVRGFAIQEGATNADLVLVRSYTVGNNTVTYPEVEKVTLAQVLEELNKDNGIFVEKDGSEGQVVNLVFNLEIDPDVDKDLTENDDDAIAFTIKAMAHQYNDN